MCNKSGSPPVPNQTSTAYQSATAPSAFVQPYYQAFLQNAQQLQGTPFNPEMEGSVAPFNDYQTQAGNALFQLGLSQAGGFPGVTDAANALSAYGAGMGTFDPSMVRSIESPYTEDVVNATQGWFNNQNAIQSNDLLSQAIRSGNAFGGDRAGVAQAQLAGQQQLAQAPVIAGLRQAGYTQALDEYNQLKQMGLGGLQAGLGAQVTSAQAPTIAQQELMTSLGFGNQVQQQQQRNLDVAQQNAMMASAYPFQVQNWYGSTLGGLGPLLGSFAQGYTTPPQPNELTQGLGIASSLIGLGTSLFGSKKYGGPVGRRQIGGLVPVRRRQAGGLVPIISGQGRGLSRRLPPRRADGGDVTTDDGTTNINVTGGMPFRSSFSLSPMSPMSSMSVPQFHAPTDAMDFMDKMKRQTKGTQQQNPNDPAALIKSLGTAAKGAAGLFALLERGGDVKGYQDAGNVTADDEDDDDEDTTDARGYQLPTPVATGAPPAFPAGALEPDAQGLNAPERNFLSGVDTPDRSYAPAGATPVGYRGGDGGGAGTMTIPGLGPAPRSFAERWAVNPFTRAGAAMLMSRSPYFGAGLGAGITAAASGIEEQRKQDLLDNKPQLIDDGKTLSYRVGNKIVKTGLRSPKAGRQEAIESRQERLERLRQEGRLQLERERYPQGRPQRGAATKDDADRVLNTMIKQELDAAKASNTPISPEEAEYNAILRFNARHPEHARPVPAKPERKPPALGPKVEDTRKWYDLTSPDPNSEAARRERGAQAQREWEERRRAGQQGAPAQPTPPPAQPTAPPAQQPAAPAQRQAQPTPDQQVERMRQALQQGGDQARQRIITQAQAAIAANPASEAEVRRRLRAAGIELPGGAPTVPQSR